MYRGAGKHWRRQCLVTHTDLLNRNIGQTMRSNLSECETKVRKPQNMGKSWRLDHTILSSTEERLKCS